MTVTVDLTDLHPAAHATWAAIANLTANTDTETWVVVGGQMVAIHATVAGVAVPRQPTTATSSLTSEPTAETSCDRWL